MRKAETSPERQPESMSTEDYARLAVDHASDRLGSDVVLLDVTGISDYADYFVIVSGETDRHLEAMAQDISRALRDQGLRVSHREGTGKGGWVLLDFPGIIVHLFTRPQRAKYDLESLWGRATEIVRVQ